MPTADQRRSVFAQSINHGPVPNDDDSAQNGSRRHHTVGFIASSPEVIETSNRVPSSAPDGLGFIHRESIHAVGTKNHGFLMSEAKRLNKKDWISRRYPATELTPLVHDPSFSTLGENEHKFSTADVLTGMIFGKKLNMMLVFIPFAFLSYYREWGPDWVFWLNFLAMIPLASMLGDFTEELAAHTNQVIGGLINATFGNAVEVVVAIQALLANEIRVVQASMIGSIFSNLLLVLGGCFFFGGLKHKEQSFNSTAATANISLLALGCMALVLPTPFAEYYDVEEERVLHISRFAALFLMLMYAQLLIFQIKTHAFLFADEDEEMASLPFWVSMAGLVIVTGVIALISRFLVDSIDGFCESTGVSKTFIGLIILPIVGNAVEHITAISVAMKDKMDLAMGVAIGSCVQIALFVIPLIVLTGWATDKNMTLNFPHFEIILLIMSVIIVSICLSNPKGNWLEGSLLMTTYCMIAMGFWYEKVVDF